MGINTIGDLADYDPTILAEAFGVMGKQMHLMARGIDRSEVEARTEVKSISHETTFEKDTNDAEAILEALDALSTEVSKEVIAQKLFFKTVTIKMRYKNFETHTHSKTLPFMTNQLKYLQKSAREQLKVYLKNDRKIRLIGVRVSNFVEGNKQKTLV
jgi:DNA polymerase IV (DinB-like DNA polymerase)